jgi:hypothetical protein
LPDGREHLRALRLPLVDPTTQVVVGDKTYCCPNCAAAMQQTGMGSDPHALEHPGALRCAHCGTPIADERTMVSRGDQAFCCNNYAAATEAHTPTR